MAIGCNYERINKNMEHSPPGLPVLAQCEQPDDPAMPSMRGDLPLHLESQGHSGEGMCRVCCDS